MEDKIIIDDVDISKCEWLSENHKQLTCAGKIKETKHYCCINNKECENTNCCYKQLQRMDKGYGELMEENARILAKLEKAEFENRKLKRENNQLKAELGKELFF